VQYHERDWSLAPQHIKHQGAGIVLDSSQGSPNVISLCGQQFGKLTLLVVPPYTDATHAYNVVMTAASTLDSSTPDQLLGNSKQGATDPPHALIALQRWESDGGAVHPAPQSPLHLQAARATGTNEPYQQSRARPTATTSLASRMVIG
jgi:hypothetical protein